ncbi:FAS1-like dehydratase domain-containing protein [Nocardia sp. NPDC004711]
MQKLAVDEDLVERLRRHQETVSVVELGEVTPLLIQRYARAIGATDPIHFDEEHARSLGFRSVVAPVNLLPSIVDWTDGGDERDLRADGTVHDPLSPGIPSSGYRLMGGGEAMTFHTELQGRDRVRCQTRLDDLMLRRTRSGPMLVVVYENRFQTGEGESIMTCRRTILVREAA